MLAGVEDYGSDNDSDDHSSQPSSTSKAVNPSKKSTFSLSSPSVLASHASSKIDLPPPKPKRGPKKITVGQPTLSNEGEDEVDERPAAKKQRLESSAGRSSLISMLPAPKQKVPVLPTPQRVLGGGGGPGLVFNKSRPTVTDSKIDFGSESTEDHLPVEEEDETPKASSTLFRPSSLGKGRANISLEEDKPPPRTAPQVTATSTADFFSLGSSSPSTSASVKSSFPPPSATMPSLPTVSSAPQIEDFTPSEPTPADPYPGYYLLPTGSWAAYDPAYYKTFYDKWQSEYNAHVRALEKGMVKGFEGLETAGAQEVNALAEMERAKKEIQEREEKKTLTQGASGAPAAPRMNIKGAKLGGRARSRHQLTTLLTEAYENREALEERIAEGRRNRKEAGNKYGF